MLGTFDYFRMKFIECWVEWGLYVFAWVKKINNSPHRKLV